MAKKEVSDIKKIAGSISKLNKWKNRLIIGSVLVVCIGVVIALGFTMIASESEEIARKYDNLTGAPKDSKQQFASRFVKITKDSNGRISIELNLGENKNDAGLGGVGDTDPGAPGGDPNGGGSGGGSGGSGGSGNPPQPPEITDQDILDDIKNGLYTAEDYNYLVALGNESKSYNGFYAVACCVRNRVNANGSSYRSEVTKSGQFAGYDPNHVGRPLNEDIKKAAVAVLRGGPSTIGDCYFFLGRVGGHDMWAEPNIDKFYNVGNNIYFNGWGNVHNSKDNKTSGAIIIYDCKTGTWKYPDGSSYNR